MADDFDARICSGSSWWNVARGSSSGGGFDASAMQSSVSSCSTAITDIATGGSGGFNWSTAEMVEAKPRPCNDNPPAGIESAGLQISGFGLSPTPPMEWNQSLLRSSGRSEPSFHAMLQEPLNYFRQDSPIEPGHQVHVGGTEEISQQFLMDQHPQHHLTSGGNEAGFPLMLQGLFDPENKPHQSSIYDPHRQVNYQSSPPMMIGTNYHGPQFLKSSPPKQQTTANQLQFANNAPFWNATADMRSGFYPSASTVPIQFTAQSFEQKPSCSTNLTTKSNSDSTATRKSGSGGSGSSSNEPALKKTRIETPSPLPTFKVRKEKLGDRITALQQLVSPFGKTDTASVLHEAIEYIKFLHNQVSALSTPYLKNGHPMQHQQNCDKSKEGEGPKQDLRSRGLCLVPIESTYPVASETTADFWTPTFGGSYR